MSQNKNDDFGLVVSLLVDVSFMYVFAYCVFFCIFQL